MSSAILAARSGATDTARGELVGLGLIDERVTDSTRQIRRSEVSGMAAFTRRTSSGQKGGRWLPP